MGKSNSILTFMRELAYTEITRAADERAAAKRDGIQVPTQERTSRSGRARIWCVTPNVVTICYTDHTNTFRYRDVPRVNWSSLQAVSV